MRKWVPIMLLGIASGIVSPARAALIDRGGGLIYDPDLDITWLQTPSNVKRWTANKDGVTNIWTYADNFTYYDSVRHKTWDDWRLPKGIPSVSGANAYSTAGELGHLFYGELNGVARQGLVNGQAPFTDLQPATYWTSTVASTAGGMISHAILDFDTGKWDKDCGMLSMSYGNYVLLVRDGDVGEEIDTVNMDAANALMALRLMTDNLPSGQTDTLPADVNGDNRIGMEEVMYIMRKMAAQR